MSETDFLYFFLVHIRFGILQTTNVFKRINELYKFGHVCGII